MIDALKALGFTDAEKIGEQKGLQIVRIRTALGWVYEKLRNTEDAVAWASRFQPPEAE